MEKFAAENQELAFANCKMDTVEPLKLEIRMRTAVTAPVFQNTVR